jgi:UDP-glucose 4-epimerase
MKKILITGVNSYVGNNLKNWLLKDPINYVVDTISLRSEKWKDKDFSSYDSIVHVAGIAHVSTDPNLEELYYKVNRDLTIEVAKKAKKDGVKQFIFLSSIIVYGNSDLNGGVITKDTIPKPSNFYGESKLQAEKGINELQSENFKIVILRPPMIYGKGSKGNYPRLAKMARIIPIFPNIDNKRSMLHIDILSEFLKLMIDNEEQGLFFPQNKEYVKTSDLVKTIAEVHEHKIFFTKLFNPIIFILIKKIGFIKKVFGNLVYEKSMSKYGKGNYRIVDLKKSIELTEK